MALTRLNSAHHLVDLKFGKTNAVVIALAPASPADLEAALQKQLKKASGIYQNEPAVLDLSGWQSEDFKQHALSLDSLLDLTRQAGMNLIEVRSRLNEHEDQCEALGLRHEHPRAETSTPAPQTDAATPEAQTSDVEAEDEHKTEAESQVELPFEEPPTERKTMVIENPVRSGQRIYAQGADVVVMGQVSAGAEVIADGNVHVYGVLRGRALAGASGDTQARILSTCFEAELVSIAGYYRTFEAGHPEEARSQPTSIYLAQGERENAIRLKPINIR